MSQRPISTVKKDFIDIVKHLSYSKERGKILSDWLEMAAISLRKLPFNAKELPIDDQFEQYEQQYLEIAKRYTSKELQQLAQLTALTTEAIATERCDFLGEIYGELELTNEDAGQFFTPFSISMTTTKMVLGNVKQQIQDKGIITISDPACGAGGMLIAAAYEIADQGIDPRSHVQFHGADIGRNCFNMTYIQLSLMDTQALIQHGNSLSLEIWETRKSPQMMFFEQWLEKTQEDQIKNNQFLARAQKMREFIRQLENPNPEPSTEEPIISAQQETLKTNSAAPQLQADIVFQPEQISLFDAREYER